MELKVRELIQNGLKLRVDSLSEELRLLKLTLRVPRLYHKYIEEHGILDLVKQFHAIMDRVDPSRLKLPPNMKKLLVNKKKPVRNTKGSSSMAP